MKPRFLSTSLGLRAFLLGSVLLAASPLVHAANIWDGGAGTGNTLTANNWDNNVVPVGGVTLTFAGNVQTTITWNGINAGAPVNIAGFTFAAAASPFTINNGTQNNIQFVSGGTPLLNSSSNLQTINPLSSVFFNGIKTFNAGSASGGFALNGGIDLRGDSMANGQTNTLNLIGTANSTTAFISQTGTFNATILNAVTKSGSGRWTVTGNATYSGATTISDGTLEYQGSISSSGITNTAALIFNNAGTQSYGNVIGGAAGTLTKQGVGTFTLSGANSYTGATTIQAGTLVAGTNAAVSANGAFGNAATAVLLGNTTGSATAALLTGGAFNIGRAITVQTGSSGAKSIGGNTNNNSTFSGAISLADSLTVTQVATTSTNTLAITGGISASTVGTKTLTFNNIGAVAVNTTAIADNLGTVAVTQAGAGTTTFNAANTYGGGTTVNAGRLLANNSSGSATGTGSVIVNGGTFGGTGAVSGAVTVNSGAFLAPGASIASLASGTVTLNNLSTFTYEVDSSVALATGADLQIVNGNLSIANGGSDVVTLTLSDLAGVPTAFADGTTFSLFNYNGTWNSGLFNVGASEIANGDTFTAGLNTWQLNYDETVAGSNFSGEHVYLNFVNIVAVPEPATLALLGAGVAIVGLTVLRRRRRPAA